MWRISLNVDCKFKEYFRDIERETKFSVADLHKNHINFYQFANKTISQALIIAFTDPALNRGVSSWEIPLIPLCLLRFLIDLNNVIILSCHYYVIYGNPWVKLSHRRRHLLTCLSNSCTICFLKMNPRALQPIRTTAKTSKHFPHLLEPRLVLTAISVISIFFSPRQLALLLFDWNLI